MKHTTARFTQRVPSREHDKHKEKPPFERKPLENIHFFPFRKLGTGMSKKLRRVSSKLRALKIVN
jgi:hypothetical protein